MHRLPDDVLEKFLKGEHVMRHNPGLWNGIWSAMFIETTFMRYGKGPGGIVGVMLKASTVKRWALSLHIISRIESDNEEMRREQGRRQAMVNKKECLAESHRTAETETIFCSSFEHLLQQTVFLQTWYHK